MWIDVTSSDAVGLAPFLKKIDPDEAPALGLRAAFALPPSEEDIAAHIQSEERARWIALDKHFGLDSTANDIAERPRSSSSHLIPARTSPIRNGGSVSPSHWRVATYPAFPPETR